MADRSDKYEILVNIYLLHREQEVDKLVHSVPDRHIFQELSHKLNL